MKDRKAIDLICLHGSVVKDEVGTPVANLFESDGAILVVKTPACSIGTYLYILSYLRELGFETK